MNNNDKPLTSSSAASTLEPSEQPIAQVFVKTSNQQMYHHQGSFSLDTANEGKLVLTPKRLLYTTYDGKEITWTIRLHDLSTVSLGESKGIYSSTPTLTITYVHAGTSKETTVTWLVPSEALVRGVSISTKMQANPHTAQSFADLVNAEKAKPATAMQIVECNEHIKHLEILSLIHI